MAAFNQTFVKNSSCNEKKVVIQNEKH